MKWKVSPAKALRGYVTVPGDKSISHRAAIISALAEGTTRIKNFLTAADCLSTVECLRKLGVTIKGPDQNCLEIQGQGAAGWQEPSDVLHAGNSGTTMRLLTGALSALPFFSVLTGDDSLRERPMDRVINPLLQMGASIRGRRGNTRAPLAISGRQLKGIYFVSPVASAQVKSAVLLAGLQAEGKTTVEEPAPTRDHTERMLAHFGVTLNRSGLTVSLSGPCRLQTCAEIIVPGDISSAAFFIVAASIVPGSEVTITGVGINPTRTGMIDVLNSMGADINLENVRQEQGEPVADITVRHSRLRGTIVAGDTIPRLIDEIPVLAVAATAADGETVITGAGELKYKESNRIKAIVTELGKMGARVQELPDGLAISGGAKLKGTRCSSWGDHRMAMALAVAGLVAEGETIVEDAGCVKISYPDFLDVLNSLVVE